MATLFITSTFQILAAFTCLLLFLFHLMRNKNSAIVNWPIVGMLPTLLWNLKHLHEFVTKTLKATGGTLEFKGPWILDADFVFTSDPRNINHIFNKNFSNYSKGPEFNMIFDVFGDGILAADSDSWVFQRKMIHKYFRDGEYQLFLERTVQEKVAKNLYPTLDHVCAQEVEVNMEDVIQRLGFDIICLLTLGCDPDSLSADFPKVAHERAFSEIEEVLLYRHIVPLKYWQLMRWLQLGEEKKLNRAWKTYDRFVYQCIESKREKHQSSRLEKESSYDFLTVYLMEEESAKDRDNAPSNTHPDEFLRDMITSLISAGRGTSSATISWFFRFLAINPSVEKKILDEIDAHLGEKGEKGGSMRSIFSAQELNKLVYLHATMCETLRLFPSLPFNHKAAVQQDTLPSGHVVGANTKILISYYAMGRMEQIWGEDCLEFKPERWISDSGEIVHVPSYKFSAFGAGPRACLGKDTSFVQMKIIAVAILRKYQIQMVEDQRVEFATSTLLHMKHGWKARVTKRSLGHGSCVV